MFSIGTTTGKWGSLLDGLLSFKRAYDHGQLVSAAIPDLAAAWPGRYDHLTLRELCDQMHAEIRDRSISGLLDRAFGDLPAPAVTPADAYRHLVRGRTERVHVTAMAGRTAAVMVVPYPPGIPVLVPGEQAGASEPENPPDAPGTVIDERPSAGRVAGAPPEFGHGRPVGVPGTGYRGRKRMPAPWLLPGCAGVCRMRYGAGHAPGSLPCGWPASGIRQDAALPAACRAGAPAGNPGPCGPQSSWWWRSGPGPHRPGRQTPTGAPLARVTASSPLPWPPGGESAATLSGLGRSGPGRAGAGAGRQGREDHDRVCHPAGSSPGRPARRPTCRTRRILTPACPSTLSRRTTCINPSAGEDPDAGNRVALDPW